MRQEIFRTLANVSSRGGSNGKVQIFIFHRVLDRPDPLSPGEPDVEQFEKLMGLVSSVFNVIPLHEAVDRMSSNSLPKRAACITFDDGYKDNLDNALPILRKFNIPFTVFVATDFIGGGMMWNDMLIETIRLHAGSVSIEELGINDHACNSWEDKRLLLKKIIPQIKYMHSPQRELFAKRLLERLDGPVLPLMMSAEEVASMHDQGVTIGAHTCSHPILSNMRDDEARQEIGGSREVLEGLLKDKVVLFAYPNGRPGDDYSQRDVELIKELGFRAAVSTRQSIATRNDDPFQLPRFTPWDKNLSKFIMRSIVENFKTKI